MNRLSSRSENRSRSRLLIEISSHLAGEDRARSAQRPPPPLVRAPLRAVPLVPDAPPRPAGDESEQEQRGRAAQGAGGGILPGEGGRHAVQDSGRPRRRPGHAPGHEPGAREPGPRHPGRRVRQGPEDVRRRRNATRRGTRFTTTKRETKPTEPLFHVPLFIKRERETRTRYRKRTRRGRSARASNGRGPRVDFFNGRTDGRVYYHIARIGTRSSLVSFPWSVRPAHRSRDALRSFDSRT